MSKKYKVILILVICAFLFVWWKADFADRKTAFDEVAIADGQKSFVAGIDRIDHIVVSTEDYAIRQDDEDLPVRIDLIITGADGQIIAECNSETNVHYNGYTNTDSTVFDNLPVQLNKGETYQIAYRAQNQEGKPVQHLSFLLYGTVRETNKCSIVFFGIVLLVLLAAPAMQKHAVIYVPVALSMILFSVVLMPTLQAEDERQAFADAYAYSNELMGKEQTDDQGNVLIEYSGIRNIGYTSYSVPLYRFWKDWNYGNDITYQASSSLFHISGNMPKLICVPEILTLTLTRYFHMPYQIVLMSGWLINLLIVGVIFFIIYRLSVGDLEGRQFASCLFIVPSVMTASLSYTALGIVIALCGLYWMMCRRIERRGLSYGNFISAFILLILIISQQYAYVVLNILLVRALRKTESEEMSRFTRKNIVIVVSMLEALIMLCMQFGGIKGIFQKATYRIGDILTCAIRYLYTSVDRLLIESVNYHFFVTKGLILATYIILLMVLLLRTKSSKMEYAESIRQNTADYRILGVWAAGIVLLLISGTTAANTNRQGLMATFLGGEAFIPFLYLPTLLRPVYSDILAAKVRYASYLMVICICLIYITRMGNL